MAVVVRIPDDVAQRVQTLVVRKQSTLPKQVAYLLEKALAQEENVNGDDDAAS